jgi:predicted dehydrogenase
MRYGIIGWGLRKSIAKLAHRPDEDHRIVALADPDPIAQDDFLEFAGPGAQVFSRFENLLDLNLDAIFVLSPDFLHEEQAVASLRAGIPIYLEKPMAITVEGCDRVLATSISTGTKLFVGHNMRHMGVIRQMKDWIDEGLIGEVKAAWCRHFVSYGGEAYFCDWHADREKSTGLLLQKGSHDIDVLHWLCSGYTRKVTAMGDLMVYGDIEDRQQPGDRVVVDFHGVWPPASLTKLNPIVDVEDVNMVLMELDNGVLASYQQCHFAPDAWRNYTIIGTKGRIENFGDSPGKSIVRLWNKGRYKYEPEGDMEVAIPANEGSHGGADLAIIREFEQFLRTGVLGVSDPLAARMSVAAGFAATRSVRAGSIPVNVAALPADADPRHARVAVRR